MPGNINNIIKAKIIDYIAPPEALVKKQKEADKKKLGLTIVTLGVYALGKFVTDLIRTRYLNPLILPSLKTDNGDKLSKLMKRKAFIRKHPNQVSQVKIKYPEKALSLDALEFSPEEALPNQWMIYFCPSGSSYEEILADVGAFAKETKQNVLFFNYRGVQLSEGKSQGNLGEDLVLDGSLAIEYLKKNKNLKEEKITLCGFSLGGGVATVLSKYYKEVSLININSFSSLSKAGGKLVAFLYKCSFLAPAVKNLMQVLGYELKAFKAWKNHPNERKIIVYHPEDKTVIRETQIFEAAKKDLVSKSKNKEPSFPYPVIQLKALAKNEKGEIEDLHSYSFEEDQEKLAELVAATKKMHS